MKRTSNRSWLGACLGLAMVSGCFEDPLPSVSTSNEESGDGDPGDGDGDPGDGDGEPGDGDGEPGDGDGEPGDGDGDPGCGPGETACGPACANTEIDSNHCGECFNVCPSMQLCGESMCKPEKYAFVTDAKYPGNFIAIQAEMLCNTAASMASLPGVYRAWISSGSLSPSGWPPLEDGVWRLRQGPVVAYSREDLFDGTLASPINFTQHGEELPPSWACNNTIEHAIWTGTNAMGMAAGPDCVGWTVAMDSEMGRIGNADATDMSWSSAGDCVAGCGTMLPLYCFQQ